MLLLTAKAWSGSTFQNTASVQNKKRLTASERAEILRRIRMLGRMLDQRFSVPTTRIRFGWDEVIGLIPGFGDFLTGALSAYIVYLAHQLEVPKPLIAKMLVNVAVDVSAGLVPVIGDVLDVAWKANSKNIQLLERHLHKEIHSSAGASEEDEKKR